MKVSNISSSLGVSASNVRKHLSTVYGKLGISSQLELLHLLTFSKDDLVCQDYVGEFDTNLARIRDR